MIRRAKLVAVLAILVAGGLALIASTQTWLTATLSDGAHHELPVSGAAAVPILAPLSLAVLALGLALTIVGRVLRYLFGLLTVAIGLALAVLVFPVASAPSAHDVASTVTTATGITGDAAVADLVDGIRATPWPAVAFACALLLIAAGILILATAHRWKGDGRRYRTTAQETPTPATSRPHDAIDDWDDLSRGDDPTSR